MLRIDLSPKLGSSNNPISQIFFVLHSSTSVLVGLVVVSPVPQYQWCVIRASVNSSKQQPYNRQSDDYSFGSSNQKPTVKS
jgi:hypothetical protein